MKATGISPARSSFILKEETRKMSAFNPRNWQHIVVVPSEVVDISINNDLRYNGGVLDLRVRDEEGLKLRRRHLEPLVLDDLLEPVDDEDLVVVINVADVPGVQPAVLVDGVLRGLGVVQVT
jgi:hypothetical protein